LAAAEARRFGGRLIVIHAYRLPAPAEYGPNAGVDEPHHRAAAEALLAQTLDQLGPDHGALKIETRAVHAGATPTLLDAAAAAAAVVVGARGSGGFGRLRIGSVSQHLLRHAPCPVLIMPGPHRPLNDPTATPPRPHREHAMQQTRPTIPTDTDTMARTQREVGPPTLSGRPPGRCDGGTG
jgi:nucleotide-binding universal stress UspA family protein